MPQQPVRSLSARSKLFADLALARGDGRYARLLRASPRRRGRGRSRLKRNGRSGRKPPPVKGADARHRERDAAHKDQGSQQSTITRPALAQADFRAATLAAFVAPSVIA